MRVSDWPPGRILSSAVLDRLVDLLKIIIMLFEICCQPWRECVFFVWRDTLVVADGLLLWQTCILYIVSSGCLRPKNKLGENERGECGELQDIARCDPGVHSVISIKNELQGFQKQLEN